MVKIDLVPKMRHLIIAYDFFVGALKGVRLHISRINNKAVVSWRKLHLYTGTDAECNDRHVHSPKKSGK